ncbi:MAG TPA: HAMP domain-containing sensor histidine kinase [Candidatus Binatia bacterium]|nr:HAMP domain-containing sensor histidine kinase [Candidatus Binatia bacterium]
MASERANRRIRAALAEVEEQRDDAVVYLSAIKLLLDVLARGQGTRQCGQEIAETLCRQLALETCAVALCDEAAEALTLAGFATRAPRMSAPPAGAADDGETRWLVLARLAKPADGPSCFRRIEDGSFEATGIADLAGEGFLVLPFAIGGETGGALVLHSLVAPAQVFARARALALVAEIVGQVLTIARMRESVVGLCTDLENELGITRRALSDQQRSLRAHEENIQSLTQALIRSNRVKREFLGTVSHELRTPLNAILGYTSLLREGMVGTVSDEQTSLLDRVLSNTRNLNWLIDDILFFVQVESDRVLLRRDRLGADELIRSVVEELPDLPGRERVPLRVEVAPAAATLCLDGAVARRLLFHLLGNAFKFTTAGEVTVAVQPGDELGAVVIAVRDTGIGIPSERIAELFELFAQADSSETRRFNGLGMGLTLVQRCVRLLNGDVAVDSRPGGGSEFRVRIPGALAAAEPERPAGTIH